MAMNDYFNDWYKQGYTTNDQRFDAGTQAAYNKWLQSQAGDAQNLKALEDARLAQKQKEIDMENARAASLKSQGLNADGSPVAPEWNSLLNPDGSLNGKYKLADWSNVNANQDALNLYRKSALRDAGTNSAWADLMLKKQEQEQAQNIDNSANQGTSNLLSTLSTIAKSGGLSRGARERQIRSTNLNSMLDKNKIFRQGQIDRTGILTQDENNRMSGLQNLQGMENQQADILFKNQQAQKTIDQNNLSNLLKEIEGKRSWDQNAYKERMSAWAANKQSEAQAKASSGGGKK